MESQLVWLLVPGRFLVSIETEEEWQFINHEIQKFGTSNTSAWHIGLQKRGGVWTWASGEQLEKWRDSEPDGKNRCAEISKNIGLFWSISCYNENTFICEMLGGKITFQPQSLLCAETLQSYTFVMKIVLAS